MKIFLWSSQSHKYFSTEDGDFPTGQWDTGQSWKQPSNPDRLWSDPAHGGTPGNWEPADHAVVSPTLKTQLISKLTQWLSQNLCRCAHPQISPMHWQYMSTSHFLTDKRSIFIISKLVWMSLAPSTIFSTHCPFWCPVGSSNHTSVGCACSLTPQTPRKAGAASRLICLTVARFLWKAAGFLLANKTLITYLIRFNADGKEAGH